MNNIVQVFVAGKPAPQGSKRYLGVKGGKGIAVESSKAVAPWRADVRTTVDNYCAGMNMPLPVYAEGWPASVELNFVMPRPASAPKKKTPAAVKRPDIDKLARAVLDALSSAGMWKDDSQVTHLVVSKRIAFVDERPGCWIYVAPAEDRRWLAQDADAERTADAAQREDR
jgi:crossover junction endodeoxyribonuclease RusA